MDVHGRFTSNDFGAVSFLSSASMSFVQRLSAVSSSATCRANLCVAGEFENFFLTSVASCTFVSI